MTACRHGVVGPCSDCDDETDRLAGKHAELLDDGSYHCLMSFYRTEAGVNEVEACHAIEWSRDEIVSHLRTMHDLGDESVEIQIAGEPPVIVHRGALHERVETPDCNYHGCLREKTFADEWERVNAVDHILAALSSKSVPEGTPGAWRPVLTGMREWRKRSWAPIDAPEELQHGRLYSQRDATVAATVVQWLGTNVGFCWLEETLTKAGYRVELKAQRDQWRRRAEISEQALTETQQQWLKAREIIEACLSDLALAALRFAQSHCANEANHFERFVHEYVRIMSNARRPFNVRTRGEGSAGQTLRDISDSIGIVIGAIHQLRDLAEGTTAQTHGEREGKVEASGAPQTTIEPQTGAQTP